MVGYRIKREGVAAVLIQCDNTHHTAVTGFKPVVENIDSSWTNKAMFSILRTIKRNFVMSNVQSYDKKTCIMFYVFSALEIR